LCATTRVPQGHGKDLKFESGYLKSLLPSNIDLPCGGAPLYNEGTFFGRTDVLEQIDEELAPIPGKESKFFTICGLGGVGKSRVALAYSKRYGGQFDVTLWIKAETQMSLSQSFAEITTCLRVPEADKNGDSDKNSRLLFDYLRTHGETLNCHGIRILIGKPT
jgi:hypothetical protein